MLLEHGQKSAVRGVLSYRKLRKLSKQEDTKIPDNSGVVEEERLKSRSLCMEHTLHEVKILHNWKEQIQRGTV